MSVRRENVDGHRCVGPVSTDRPVIGPAVTSVPTLTPTLAVPWPAVRIALVLWMAVLAWWFA